MSDQAQRVRSQANGERWSNGLEHFAQLTHDEQVAAVHRLARIGWTDSDISRLTGLHPEQVRRALAP